MSAHVTAFQPDPTRTSVRCDNCHLVQFESVNGKCRKCHAPFKDSEPASPPETQTQTVAAPEPEPPVSAHLLAERQVDIAFAVLTLRRWRKWSQRELSFHSGMVRTYISSLERTVFLPNIKQIERVAAAFGISPRDFMTLATIGTE